MENLIENIDLFLVQTIRKWSVSCARIALFIVFFWFGILKLFYTSPANPLVEHLLAKTLPFITFNHFIIFLGVWEMLIGITFLIPRLERLAILLLIPHMFTTVMPLFLLPSITWQGFLTPTLEGQYIIKNLVIIALAMMVAAQLQPFKEKV